MSRTPSPAPSWAGRSATDWQKLARVPAFHIHRQVGSTNDVARGLASAGAERGTTVVAEEQLSGRGRAGRSWSAPAGQGLLVSVILRGLPGTDPSAMPLRVGLAAARAIERACGVATLIKWPNDLIVPARGKLGGILCETTTGAGGFMVAGIGINVLQTAADFPAEIRAGATSIRLAGGRTDPATLLEAVLDEIRPFSIEPPPLSASDRAELDRRDALLGHDVAVDGRFAGTAIGTGPDGALLIRTAHGLRTVREGTVRPVPGTAAGHSLEAGPAGRRP